MITNSVAVESTVLSSSSIAADGMKCLSATNSTSTISSVSRSDAKSRGFEPVNTRSFNKTTEGLIKAAMQLEAQRRRRAAQPTKRPKYLFERAGTAIHTANCLPVEQRRHFDATIKVMQDAIRVDDTETFEAAKATLQKLPLKLVPVKRGILQTYGKNYTYSGRKKELARAARRIETPALRSIRLAKEGLVRVGAIPAEAA